MYTLFTAKLDSSGNALHAIATVNPTMNAEAFDIALGAQGLYITGVFEGAMTLGTTTLNAPAEFTETFTAGLDTACNYKWATQLHGTSHNGSGSVALTNDGFAVAGWFQNTLNFSDSKQLQSIGGFDTYYATFSTPSANGVHQVDKPDFALYPNPARTSIHIQEGTSQTRIITIDGKEIAPSIKNGVVDVSSLTPGSYYIKTERGVLPFIKLP